VRFEAPPDVCLKYAAAVAQGAALQPVDEFQLSNTTHVRHADGVLTDFRVV
jgi:hypothetical protein